MAITREFETTFAYDSLRNGLTSQYSRGNIFTDTCPSFSKVTWVGWWEQVFRGN